MTSTLLAIKITYPTVQDHLKIKKGAPFEVRWTSDWGDQLYNFFIVHATGDLTVVSKLEIDVEAHKEHRYPAGTLNEVGKYLLRAQGIHGFGEIDQTFIEVVA